MAGGTFFVSVNHLPNPTKDQNIRKKSELFTLHFFPNVALAAAKKKKTKAGKKMIAESDSSEDECENLPLAKKKPAA